MFIIKLLYIIGIACLLPGGIVYLFMRHQRKLKDRAFMMREAVRNGDYSFKLPANGLLPGERALQQALNDMEGDIAQLVAKHEVESWQKLTRVLTHEIMNATAPVTSICQAYLNNPKTQGTPYEKGIRAIRDTSRSLTAFVENYRKLTQLQEPAIGTIALRSFAESIKALYPAIEWHVAIPDDATIDADEDMLRQVFINLVKNAVEAKATAIDIRCYGSATGRGEETASGWGISVSNNGAPIPADVASDMFVPFFTTKPSGTGIGLSLSRQMLTMQNITIALAQTAVTGYHVTFNILAHPQSA